MRAELSRLQKRYGKKTVVDDVSVEVADGEFLVILGPSGCGKTTTLRLLAGLETPDAGTIAIGDRIVSDPASGIFIAPDRRNLGMVFQSYAIWPHLSVFENVAYPLRLRRERRDEIVRRVGAVLELVGLEADAQRSATALSGGQMQRVALARAIVYDPAVLLFDEPLSNLDLKLRERLRIELKHLQKRTGLTSVYVTHDQAEAVELGDRVVVMNHGRIVQIGAPVDLFGRPRTRFVAEFIGTANILMAKVEDVLPDGGRVRLDGGQLLAAQADERLQTGSLVAVVVHPEDCALAPPSADSDDEFRVRIAARQFQGTSTRYTVDWRGVMLDVITLGTGNAMYAPGGTATLALGPNAARVVADDDVPAASVG